MAQTYNEIVAGEVRAEMARQKRSQDNLSAELGWTQAFLSRRLTGKNAFSTDEIEAVARALGVPLAQLADPAQAERDKTPAA
jgi:transcriptional regulator with XRE-family HTH domain